MNNEHPGERFNWLVIQCARQHYIRLHALLSEIGLYRGQPPLLHLLKQNSGCTQTDLAVWLDVQPSTITKMLQRMDHTGYIERKADPTDQRAWRVSLTESGEQIEQATRERENQVGEEMLAGFTPQEREVLTGFLVRMRDNLVKANGREHPEQFFAQNLD